MYVCMCVCVCVCVCVCNPLLDSVAILLLGVLYAIVPRPQGTIDCFREDTNMQISIVRNYALGLSKNVHVNYSSSFFRVDEWLGKSLSTAVTTL